MNDCIFCKIIAGTLPSEKIYDSHQFIGIIDIHPVNLGHVLLVPKEHHETLFDLPEELLEELGTNLKKLATAVKAATKAEGVNIGMNNHKAAGQLVPHAHIHIIPRFENDGHTHWKGAPHTPEEFARIAEKIRMELAVE